MSDGEQANHRRGCGCYLCFLLVVENGIDELEDELLLFAGEEFDLRRLAADVRL